MLIGDIWLYKRQANSQHLLESGNLKFNPLVSAEPARRDDAKSYTSRDQGGRRLLHRSLLCKLGLGAPTLKPPQLLPCPSRDRTPLKMAATDLERPRLPLPAPLLLRDWMRLCGVTNARSKEPGGHCAGHDCVRVCSQSARQGWTSSHEDEPGSQAAPPDIPTYISSPFMQIV